MEEEKHRREGERREVSGAWKHILVTLSRAHPVNKAGITTSPALPSVACTRSKFPGCLLGLGCWPRQDGCCEPPRPRPPRQQHRSSSSVRQRPTHSLGDVTDTCSDQGSKLNLHPRCLHHVKAGFNASLTKHKHLCNKQKIHFIVNEPFQEDKTCLLLSNPSIYFCSSRTQDCIATGNKDVQRILTS